MELRRRARTMIDDEVDSDLRDLWGRSDFVDDVDITEKSALADVLGRSVPDTLAMLRSERRR